MKPFNPLGPALAASLMALAGCGAVEFEEAQVGRLDGTLLVMWVEEGSSTVGDGKFVYVPVPGDPLRFERSNPDATVRRIEPEMIYSDGGSIPKMVQMFNGFAPWGYAPAYVVHDWLFVARQCVRDGMATKKEAEIARMSFQESAEVMAEVIRTMMENGTVAPNDLAGTAISGAVAGPFSEVHWRRKGACAERRVSDEHRKRALAAIGQAQGLRRGPSLFRDLPDGGRVAVPPARIVGVFEF